MSKLDTGSAAFPVNRLAGELPGMELLDYFAGQALMGMIASSPVCDRTDPLVVRKDVWACQAYSFAQAMIAEKRRLESAE